MRGRGIEGLYSPSGKYHVCSCDGDIETEQTARREDGFRSRRLRMAMAKYPELIDAERAERLANHLRGVCTSEGDGASLASSEQMRYLRVNFGGHLWQLVDRVGPGRVHTFTIIPQTWQVTSEKLADLDPSELLRKLSEDLHLQGAAQADGWIIAFIHGEWDPIRNVFRLHVHGFAHGGMMQVIDRLRSLPNYATRLKLEDGSPNPVFRRVWLSKEPLNHLPYQIVHRLQSYWPSKALTITRDGTGVRCRRKDRLPEPQYSQVLLWMDRWKIDDLTLMIGLRLANAGLKQTKPVR